MNKTTVSITREIHEYDILVGYEIHETIQSILSAGSWTSLFVVTDQNVYDLYNDIMQMVLNETGIKYHIMVLSPGESKKDLESITGIIATGLSVGLDRHGAIIAWGGGVVGDIAGFAASIFKRGISFYQIPTTLLAQVDSSVGGKVGVNYGGFKNQIGSFYHPVKVMIDISYLHTLPLKEYLSGIAEVIKYGLILDSDLFEFIRSEKVKVKNRNYQVLQSIVSTCCELKRSVVENDEREHGIREILNFGHTVGHGIEYALNPGAITHGEAVALGMMIESRISYTRGKITKKKLDAIEYLLDEFGYLKNRHPISAERVMEGVSQDKKKFGHAISIILLNDIGSATKIALTEEELRSYLVNYLPEYL